MQLRLGASAFSGMMELIEPNTFDVIVASSGLVECLLASALARAGKSVLLMDGADVYGSSHASFTFAGLCGIQDPELNPHASSTQQARQSPHVPEGFRCLDVSRSAGQGLPLRSPESCWAAGQGLAQTRGFILDLAPKVLYQAEPLVDVLVRTRSHHYLEFKAVDGSFIYQGGRLRLIPASRADIFKDKTMGLKDKRQLMTFLSACMSAHEGQGPMQAVLNSPQALRDVLQSQGLNQDLQDIVLYGIACAPQAQQDIAISPRQGSTSTTQGSSTSSSSGVVRASEGLERMALYAASLGRFGSSNALMVASYGSGSLPEAFVRHCAVKGAVTALRQPVVSVVLGPRGGVLVQPTCEKSETDREGGTEVAASGEGMQGEGVQGEGTPQGSGEAQGGTQAAGGDGDRSGKEGKGEEGGTGQGDSGEDPGEEVVKGVVLASGQVLACRHALIMSQQIPRYMASLSSTASPTELAPATTTSTTTAPADGLTHHPQQEAVKGGVLVDEMLIARAVVVLDSSVVPGQGLITLVLPPNTPGVANIQPVYGIQLSSAASVAPVGKYVLYLSTCITDSHQPTQLTPRQLLEPALAVLAQLPPAQSVGTGVVSDADGHQGAVTAEPHTPAAQSSSTSSTGQGTTVEGVGEASTLPKVLHVHYYQQLMCRKHAQVQIIGQGVGGGGGDDVGGDCTGDGTGLDGARGSLVPHNLVVCGGDCGSLFGYESEVREAEELLVRRFPGVPWLLAPEPVGVPGDDGDQGEGAEEGEQGGRSAGVVDEDEEDSAIEELQRALGTLMATGTTTTTTTTTAITTAGEGVQGDAPGGGTSTTP